MIVMQLMGGLGNQMFQYAAALALSKKRKLEVKFDFDDPYKFVKRQYSLGVFGLEADFAGPGELRKCKAKRRFVKRLWMLLGRNPDNRLVREQRDFYFDPGFFNCPDGAYLSGFWQSYKYFAPIESEIRTVFRNGYQPAGKNTDWLRRMNECNSVSVHIRRGDYVTVAKTNAFHGTCSPAYYENAMNRMREVTGNPVFFFFSDDLQWVREHFKAENSFFVETTGRNSDYEELMLMSNCKHHIIANSSFSWWGAWLNPSMEKTVIAPAKWLEKINVDTTDLLPEQWVKL